MEEGGEGDTSFLQVEILRLYKGQKGSVFKKCSPKLPGQELARTMITMLLPVFSASSAGAPLLKMFLSCCFDCP